VTLRYLCVFDIDFEKTRGWNLYQVILEVYNNLYRMDMLRIQTKHEVGYEFVSPIAMFRLQIWPICIYTQRFISIIFLLLQYSIVLNKVCVGDKGRLDTTSRLATFEYIQVKIDYISSFTS